MKKTTDIKIRLTAEEKQGFKRAAEVSGMKVATWARVRLREKAIRELEDVGERAPFIRPVPLKVEEDVPPDPDLMEK